jgi:translation initiation factor IF-1
VAEQKAIRCQGIVKEKLPNAMFRVTLEDGHEVLAHVSGKIRMRFIRIMPGDRVTLELTPYRDTASEVLRGRIVWLHR